MISFLGQKTKLCDGLSRREWLRVGGLSAFGLSLAQLQTAHTNPIAPSGLGNSFGKAKRCIVLFMLGGPPQHETWDPKPNAPSEIRGDFGTIPTATPGYQIGRAHV